MGIMKGLSMACKRAFPKPSQGFYKACEGPTDRDHRDAEALPKSRFVKNLNIIFGGLWLGKTSCDSCDASFFWFGSHLLWLASWHPTPKGQFALLY